ncbi:hypothetical protein JRQ81_007961 [Phrynocephalus forsythii]|uniref:Uncharacterized protein n=1 Tax=Phrynocephalus forsythii TaxID=171643 RepID=A0A9Q0XCG3_9SAUR|nr:hypothetical protein JRQ81_007961 [Phrynocephalus forsythii]
MKPRSPTPLGGLRQPGLRGGGGTAGIPGGRGRYTLSAAAAAAATIIITSVLRPARLSLLLLLLLFRGASPVALGIHLSVPGKRRRDEQNSRDRKPEGRETSTAQIRWLLGVDDQPWPPLLSVPGFRLSHIRRKAQKMPPSMHRVPFVSEQLPSVPD